MRQHNRLYTLLNVLPEADPVVIEAAYKALIKRYHPDIHSGGVTVGERIAADLNHAYQTLRDPDRRAAYDAEERAREERRRAELARSFDPPPARPVMSPVTRPEPARAGQRAAGWIAAAGILLLSGAIYLLAQAVENVPVRSAAADDLASPTSPREAQRAFRDQPVNRSEIERAVAEFRRVGTASGMPGVAGYSNECFNRQSRTRAIGDFDHCVAFDHLASRADAATEVPGNPRFQPQSLVMRHIRAAETIARDPSLIEARLYEIRRLTDSEAGRAQAVGPTRLSGAAPAPRPAPRASERPTRVRQRSEPASIKRAVPRRAAPDQDFLEREGGIY